MIDLHCHVLPGVDDGPRTLEESLELLEAAHADGIERIAATPHVRDDYPTSADRMVLLVAEVRDAAREAAIPVDVLPGGELDLEFMARLDDATLRRFGLGGNARLLLVETPYRGWPLRLPDTIFRLRSRGFTALLAHPERNADVQADPALLHPVVQAGALVQLTAASLDGRMGAKAEACSHELLDRGLAHVLASDAHGASVRAAGLGGAVEAIDSPALAAWLTRDVPEALLLGFPVPHRPRRTEPRRTKRRHVPWRA